MEWRRHSLLIWFIADDVHFNFEQYVDWKTSHCLPLIILFFLTSVTSANGFWFDFKLHCFIVMKICLNYFTMIWVSISDDCVADPGHSLCSHVSHSTVQYWLESQPRTGGASPSLSCPTIDSQHRISPSFLHSKEHIYKAMAYCSLIFCQQNSNVLQSISKIVF